MTAVGKGSSAPSMVFHQSESVAARRAWPFHLCLTADQSDGTGLVPVVTISKDGGAFGAIAGAVTEISGGWYKCAFAAADLDTIGALAVHVAVATADSLNTGHQVNAIDENANVTLADASLTAAKFSSDALAAMGGALISKPTATIGTLSAGTTSFKRSMKQSFDTVVLLSGTFGGSTVQIQTTEDENAVAPVWTDRSSGGLTAAGNTTLTGPHSAWRAIVTGGTATAVVVKAVDRVYQGVK